MCPSLSADLQLMDDQDHHHQQGAGTTQHRCRLSPGNPAGRQWVTYGKRLHFLMARPVPGRAEAVPHRFCREELTETPSGGSSRIVALCTHFVAALCEHHICLHPDSDLHLRNQGSILWGSLGNTIRNPKFRGHTFARRFQHSWPTGKHGLRASATSASPGWMRTGRGWSNSAVTTVSASPTATLSVRSCTKCLADTLGPTTGTS